MSEDKVWLVTGRSDSGDDYGCFAAFMHEPSEEELKRLLHVDQFGDDGWTDNPDDWQYGDMPGPGMFGSYMYVNVQAVDVQQ